MKRVLVLLALAVFAITPCVLAQAAAPDFLNSAQAPAVCTSQAQAPAALPDMLPAPQVKTTCSSVCTTQLQRICHSQGGLCTLNPDTGSCGCYYP